MVIPLPTEFSEEPNLFISDEAIIIWTARTLFQLPRRAASIPSKIPLKFILKFSKNITGSMQA